MTYKLIPTMDYRWEYTVISFTFPLNVDFDFVWLLTKRYSDL